MINKDAIINEPIKPFESQILQKSALESFLRINLSCHMGKIITQELLTELSTQMIESIDYFNSKKEG